MPLPTPVREQVLQALFTALQSGLAGDGGPALAAIERNRRPENQVFPAVFLVDAEGLEEIAEETGIDRVTMSVTLEGQVRGAQDADLGPSQTLLMARVIRAALTDPTLGGLAANMMRGAVGYELDRDGSPPTAGFKAELLVEYITLSGDPFTAGP